MAFSPFKRSIASYAAESENNYLLLRFVAALMVIYGHSYAITRLPGHIDLVQRLLRFTYAGGVGVDAFFIISGFLVTASYLDRRHWPEFMKARCLRIFPGLIVCLLAIAFLLGPFVTTLRPTEYLFGPQLYADLLQVLTLHLRLPGVFEDLPQQAVNGSLWTLPPEFLLYLLVSMAGLSGMLFRPRIYVPLLIGSCALGIVLVGQVHFFHDRQIYLRLFLLFGAGSLVRVLSDRIPLSTWLLAAAAVPVALLYSTPLFPYAFNLWLVYAVFWFAYVPNLRRFNRAGDYSYGLYIYAFPIEQTLRQSFPAILPLELFAAASALTLGCAMLSWHFIEQPALRLKDVRLRDLLRRHATLA
ncbi:MAG TPA: acyltransferase [Gammaproteobacteria bacterium]|nr:acyltransferase [Gammaproteobacteria bacterium]